MNDLPEDFGGAKEGILGRSASNNKMQAQPPSVYLPKRRVLCTARLRCGVSITSGLSPMLGSETVGSDPRSAVY